MVGHFDPRDPGDYDRVRARINEVMDAVQRETIDGRSYRSSLVAREKANRLTSRRWTRRLGLALLGAVALLGIIGLLMQR